MSRGHTCTHAHSRQTCSFPLFSHPFPSLSKISISLISPNAGATKFRPLFPRKKWDRVVFCFSVCRMLRFRLRRCTASKARRLSEEDRPRSPGGFLCHCAPKRFKIDGRISLFASLSLPLSLCERLRCQLHLLRLLQPNSSRTVSKGVSEFKARRIACFAVPLNQR